MDEQLKKAFAQLRAEERASAPPFDVTAVRIRPTRRVHWAVGSAALAAAIAAVVLWPGSVKDDVVNMSITEWHAPTDVLLKTPGSELLTDMPALDESMINLKGSP